MKAEPRTFSVLKHPLHSIEHLRQPIADADLEIVQLAGGQFKGVVTKLFFPNLAVSRADVTRPVRTRGILGSANLTITMVLAGRSMSFGHPMETGHVYCVAPGGPADFVTSPGLSKIGLSIPAADIAAHFASEHGALADVGHWMENRHYRGNLEHRMATAAHVAAIMARLETADLSDDGSEFWQRAMIEVFSAAIMNSLSSDSDYPIPSAARLVREADFYLDSNLHRAVHISELCDSLAVSRRTLHRAFHDVLGVGPVSFLRYRRLCAAHYRLRRDPSLTVARVATEFGFADQSRFSQYYIALLGQYPSQTLATMRRGASQ